MNENRQQQCSNCGKWFEEVKLLSIDGSPCCTGCMYGGMEPFEIYPIGTVRNKMKTHQDRGRVADAKDESMI